MRRAHGKDSAALGVFLGLPAFGWVDSTAPLCRSPGLHSALLMNAPHPKTGLILASGRGSRMGTIPVPKHLLKLPDGTPIIRRIATELAPLCTELFCTIRSEQDRPLFEAALAGLSPAVKLHVKQGNGEYAEIAEIAPVVTNDTIIQTNGDLIFGVGTVRAFVERHGDGGAFVMGREGNPANRRHALDLINSRISIVPRALLPHFGTRTVASRGRIVLAILAAWAAGRVIDVPTLFNVDTQADYATACAALALQPTPGGHTI